MISAANYSDEPSSSVELKDAEKTSGRAELVHGIFNQKAADELSSSKALKGLIHI